MPTLVITGSTRGIGYGLAESFLRRGCKVVLSSRSEDAVAIALQRLDPLHSASAVHGFPCDVRKLNQVQALWNAAAQRFGQVDIWINNAGLSGPFEPILAGTEETTRAVLETNLTGLIHGSRTAAREMLRQGTGAIYNMEGLGSDGRKLAGLAIYGTSKYAVRYFTDALVAELANGPVRAGSIQPGMVVTEFLLAHYAGRPEAWERAKRIFNILAERVEIVTPWLARRILENRKHGVRIVYASRWKLLLRFLTAPFHKRDLFQEKG